MTLLEQIQKVCTPELIASRDFQAIAAAVTAARPPVVGKVERAEFATWAASTGMRSKIEDAANDHASPLRDSALGCRDVLLGGAATGIDFSISDNLEMLNAWVISGFCTEENRDKLLALATRPAPARTAAEVEVAMKNDDGSWKL